MSVKVRGGMICPRCGPVAAQKSTAKAYKTMAAATGVGLLAVGPGKFHCPNCGGPVKDPPITRVTPKGWFVLACVVLFMGACSVNAAVGGGDGSAPTTTECPSYITNC